jgi:ectoine hydroxylase-related dioxygenase (phytanoyl-CoA dioxygenase family)
VSCFAECSTTAKSRRCWRASTRCSNAPAWTRSPVPWTAIVPLVDFTAGNGATRIVPGSHREPLRDASRAPDRPHPRERLIGAPAGAAIVINGHVWHSGTKNRSDRRRDALQITFRPSTTLRQAQDDGTRCTSFIYCTRWR